MSAPTSATSPRPWHTRGRAGSEVEDAAGQVVVCGNWNEYGCGYPPNAAFIVYAVNHIEEAERLLERLVEAVLDRHADLDMETERARAFLRAAGGEAK